MRILFIVKLDEVLLAPSHSTIKLLPTQLFFFFFNGKHIVLPLQLFLHFLYSLGAALYSILCVLSLLVLSSAALQSRPLPPPLSSPFSLSWDFLLVINIFVSRLSRCSHRSQLLLPICWLDTHGPCSWTHQRLPAVPPHHFPHVWFTWGFFIVVSFPRTMALIIDSSNGFWQSPCQSYLACPNQISKDIHWT